MKPSFNHDEMLIGPYLEHHGKKGMKWGVRNYQNYDGSLTPAGRARYGVGDPRGKGGGDKSAANTERAQKKVYSELKKRRGIDIDKLPNNKERSAWEKARRELSNAKNPEDDYWNDTALVKKYATKLAENTWDDAVKSGWDKSRKNDYIRAYTEGDLDQGESFNLYRLDMRKKGRTLDDAVYAYRTLVETEDNARKAYAKSVLGDYADKPLLDNTKDSLSMRDYLSLKLDSDASGRKQKQRQSTAEASAKESSDNDRVEFKSRLGKRYQQNLTKAATKNFTKAYDIKKRKRAVASGGDAEREAWDAILMKGRGPFERYLDSNRLTKKPASDLSDDEIKKLLAKELRG